MASAQAVRAPPGAAMTDVKPSASGPHPEELAATWPFRPNIRGRHCLSVAGHYLGAEAGFMILANGGNAIDAGVAAGIVEAIVQPDQVNFSGVAPCLVFLAESRRLLSICGLGGWPRKASCAWFRDNFGAVVPEGILRTVVPAAPGTWIFALREFGTLSFADVVRPALELAREGFPINEFTCAEIRKREAHFRRWSGNAAVFLPQGRLPGPGDIFVQSDLARSLQYMVDAERAQQSAGRDAGLLAAHNAYYKGDIAAAIARYHKANGGLLDWDDLAEYQPRLEPTASIRWRGLDVHTCGFWTQGPVLLQALGILSGYDLSGLGHNSADYLHVVAESLKLAFADREACYGDPDFVNVPAERLLSADYAAERRNLVSERAWSEMPPSGAGLVAPLRSPTSRNAAADTSFVCAVDRAGNVFCASPSDPTYDTEIIPGLGLSPSSRGSQSRTDPDHPAAIAPGKRPRLTPNPVLVLKDGEPHLAMGTPGGDVQPQALLQVLLGMEVFGMPAQNAIETSRIVSRSFPDSFAPHAYFPGELNIEGGIDESVGRELSRRGHVVNWWPRRTSRAGGVCAVAWHRHNRSFTAGADFRRAGYAVGW